MTDEEISRLQQHLREMYLDVEKVCNRHNLNMMMGFGNVIGALRHQGFIPWDDDVDLLMPRKDYDELITKYADELPSKYKVFAPNSKNGPIYRFAKVVDTSTKFITPLSDSNSEATGIYIDIFPLEFSPINRLHIRIRQVIGSFIMLVASAVDERRRGRGLYKALMCSTHSGRVVYYFRSLVGFCFSFVDAKVWYNLFDKFANYKKDNGGYVIPSSGHSIKQFSPLSKDVFIPAKRMKYDDIEVWVPHMPERHCEYVFGDWKRIPPPDKRWRHFMVDIQFGSKDSKQILEKIGE